MSTHSMSVHSIGEGQVVGGPSGSQTLHQLFRRLLIERIQTKTSWGKNELRDLINEVYAEVF